MNEDPVAALKRRLALERTMREADASLRKQKSAVAAIEDRVSAIREMRLVGLCASLITVMATFDLYNVPVGKGGIGIVIVLGCATVLATSVGAFRERKALALLRDQEAKHDASFKEAAVIADHALTEIETLKKADIQRDDAPSLD